MNKKTALPIYRFTEFKLTPEWSVAFLKDFSIPIKKRAGKNKYTPMSVSSGVGLVPQMEKFGREIAGSSYKNYILIQRGDFAYNKSATKLFPEGYIAMLSEYDEAALPNSIFTCFHIANEEVCIEFIDQLFQSNYHGAWLRQFITVGARAHGSLNVDDKHLWEMPVALPKFQEQQKIADCLTSLDELITAEMKKLDILKTHKKGLLQKLLPAEGQAVPEFRFSEFKGSGEWNISPIEKLAKITTGNKDTQNKIDDGAYPFYVRSQIIEKINTYALDCEAILTSGDGVGVGKNFHYVDGKFDFHQRVYCIYDFDNDVVGKYLFYYFTEHFYDRVMKLSAKNSVDSVRRAMIAEMPISISKPEEQQKIADCLSAIDDEIAAQTEKIAALKQHKKGLMQGLFPSAQEVFA